jgi:xylan 1,4-beta-xylosidase
MMQKDRFRAMAVGLAVLGAGCFGGRAKVVAQAPAPRVISGDLAKVKGPRDMAWQMCVGSGHAGLMLSDANQAQLAEVEREVGFRYIRFHGLLTDDMHVYSVKDGVATYDFTRIDLLYDKLLRLGIKPLVELGFMPKDLASGTQETFYWHANVTPPRDMAKWTALIEALTRHLQSRYGEAEVKTWYFEVWNEPNYPGFWPNANQAAYFSLYDATSAAIKRVNPAFRVGGPATAGAGWVPEFIAHTQQSHVPVDFVSTHTYAVSSGFLDVDGKADLVLSRSPDAISGDVKRVHEQIAASARPELLLFMTEWSASYSSRDPVHDSYTSAAFILDKLKQTESDARAMSYWTYSDLFEENGPPPAAFHGGFGLLTRDDLPKAAYFSYKYLDELGDVELVNRDPASWLTTKGRNVEALLWDFTSLKQDEGNKGFYRRLHPAAEAAPVDLRLRGLAPGRYVLKVYRTGYRKNDAYSTYIDMGLPTNLSPGQKQQLQALVKDEPESTTDVTVSADGSFERTISMRQNDVVFVSLGRQ